LRFVDSNIFIYVLMKSPKKDYEIARGILERIQQGEASATSLAVILEVADFLEYNNRRKEVKTFIESLNSYLSMEKLPFEWNDAILAMDYEKMCGLGFVDGLTVQIMKKHKITEIYSCDKDFDRVKGVKRIWE